MVDPQNQATITKIATQIKARREEYGYSQVELALLADIGIRSVQRIERKEMNPSLTVLQKICTVLDLELRLVKRNDENNTSTPRK